MSAGTSSAAIPTCPQHPEVTANYVCARCQTAMCGDCCYTMPDNSVCCKVCYQAEVATEAPPAAEAPPVVRLVTPKVRLSTHSTAGQAAVQTITPLRGQGCVQHPHLMPVARCHGCGAGSCRTCDVVFPGNLHYCPVCAAAATGQLSPRRKKYVITAYALAGWATVGLVLFFAVAVAGTLEDTEGGEIAAALFLMVLVGLPTIIGTAFGMSAKRAGGPNPVSVWVAFIWNALLAAGLVALIVIGNLTE